VNYTLPLARLIDEFRRLPGVGPKSAQRLAFHVLKQSEEDVRRFAHALVDARERVGYCQRCYNLSAQPICDICRQPGRQRTLLCVVAEPRDLYALERTNEYKGLYHVLQGLISPLEGIGPQDLKIRELINRLGSGVSQDVLKLEGSSPDEEDYPPIQEAILALPPSIEGDTTSLYLARLLKPVTDLRLTRIAFGLPVGADLEYADSMTITRALQGRQLV
jgi:recombination protein RecR